jgi:SAM-dependent methyltransferase
VTRDGLWGDGTGDPVLDVVFDGQVLWSLRFLRDSEPRDTGRLAPWPKELLPHLDGLASVLVREHGSGHVLFDQELRLGTGTERIALLDEQGRPLSINSKGHLTSSLAQRGPTVVATLLDAAEDVLAAMRASGVDGFLAYGTLLGAARTGHVIGHDYDVDLAYLSGCTDPVDAITESYRLERAIRARGHPLRRYSALAFQVGVDPDDPTHPWLDVFGALFVGQTLYVMWDVAAPLRREQVVPLGTCVLEGRSLPSPRDVDAWLSATYGPSWRQPDPSFRYATPVAVRRRLGTWFGGLVRGRRFWDEAHAAAEQCAPYHQPPSDFARWVAEQEPDAELVVDLGCGRGTDAVWWGSGPYASQRVLGMDASAVALEAARARAARLGSAAAFQPVNFGDLRSTLVTGALLSSMPGRRLVSVHLVAEWLNAAQRAYLWRLARMALRGQGRLYLELVRAADPRSAGAAPNGRWSRRLPVRVVREELEAVGATLQQRQAVASPGSGPDTIRMVWSWPS